MVKKTLMSLSILALILVASSAMADNSGRIYGTITTVDGDIFTGYIRWDKNEACWVDKLDGTKELPDRRMDEVKRRKYRDRGKNSIEIFGIKIGEGNVSWDFGNATSGVMFGHLKSLEVTGNNEALLTFKSGHEVEFSGGSTDIGDDIREIIIEDPDEGEIEFVWDDIERVDFASTRGDEESSFGERLYGTLTTRRGDEYTGFVCWDVDEVFTTDILDGEEKGRNRKIKFGKISAIERYSSNGAMVHLTNGDEVLLRESNDVDDSNRGIIISDPAFGQLRVDWDEFERLDFKAPGKPVRYDEFEGGKELKGTVYTEDGDRYQGTIIWDHDEEFSWEILDGSYHDIEFDIEFSKIKEIVKKSYRSSVVTIRDGRTFKLRDSNDVDEDNKGIIILDGNGDETIVDWEDFDRLELD